MSEEDKSHLLVGIWKLVEIVNKDADGNILRTSYGPKKMGIFVFNDDHRAMVVLSDGRENLPSDRPREYSSYSGRYRFDGKTVRTEIDCSAVPERVVIGSEQVRPARIEGNRITLTAPPIEIEGVVNYRDLTWERIE